MCQQCAGEREHGAGGVTAADRIRLAIDLYHHLRYERNDVAECARVTAWKHVRTLAGFVWTPPHKADATLDGDGNLVPRQGTVIPSREEISNLIQQIVIDVAGEDASVSQHMAEQFARYLDAIYSALAASRPLPMEAPT